MPEEKKMTERSQFLQPAGAGSAAAAATTPLGCPTDREEMAELYLLGHLGPVDSAAFQQHSKECRECQEILENLEGFISALKSTVELFDISR